MAGVVPFLGGTPGRKQWNIKDRKSSRKFRTSLAEDGCPQSQVVLAKQLLEEKSVVSVDDKEENARLGVFWLIKASEQGNEEATNILRQCLETGKGITEHNYVDVKACLNTSQNEKLAKRAAREMFMSLSEGQNFITSEQLRKRMNKISCDDETTSSFSRSKEGNQNLENNFLENEKADDETLKKNLESDGDEFEDKDDNIDWSAKNEKFEKLTEDHLESAASHYSKGELPLVQGICALADSNDRNIGHLNCLQRTLLYPFITVQKAHLKLLNNFSQRYRNHFFFFFHPFTCFQFFTIFLLYPLITVENILLFLPMCIYYTSFFFMVVSTLQMLQSKKEFNDFRVWSRLFLSYDREGSLNTDDAEFEFCKKNMRPYGLYFFCLLLNLVVYPFISEFYIPQSEFAIISFALTFLTLYTFHQKTAKKVDFLLLFSFAINVLAKYPYETDGVVRQTWRFLDVELPTLKGYGLSCFVSQIVGNGVEFCLNFRGVFYLLIPGIFFKMASRDNWRGIYKILIPHCVTLSWWQVAVFCCQGATLYGLLRSTLAVVGLVFFLPLAGIATTILPIVAIFKHFADAALTSKNGLAIVIISIPIVFIYYRRQLNLRSNIFKIQVLLAVISAMFLLSSPLIDFFSENVASPQIQEQSRFTWDLYSSVCQKGSWDKRTDAEIQVKCIQLNGIKIDWKGVVDNVKVVKIENNLSKFLSHFPDSLKTKVLCYYGESYEVADCSKEESNSPEEASLCSVLRHLALRDKCHVNAWNKYELEISIKMNTDKWNSIESAIKLIVEDSMKNFTLKLQPKDYIWFSGVMNYPETIGTDSLKITANEIGCINCFDKNLVKVKKASNKFTGRYFAKEIYNGFKRILNFVFNPVINFR